MLDTCHDLGFGVNPDKVTEPNTVMEYLGIVLDTDLMQARISQERLDDIMAELEQWHNRSSASKRQILSLVGKLQFVSRVVRPGRTFLRRMISASKQVPHLHQHVRLTTEFQQDVQWWLHFLPTFNGVCLFYDDQWLSNVDLHIYTDSSDIAAAGFYDGSWFVVPFTGAFAPLQALSINWRELFAVTVAAATFGHHWSAKRIMFHCDNQSIVDILCSGTSKSDLIMTLVRELFFIAAKYQFEMSACYVNTRDNSVADSLSRLQFTRFQKLAPHADTCMTTPVFW